MLKWLVFFLCPLTTGELTAGATPGLTLQPDAEFQTAALFRVDPGLFAPHPSLRRMDADRHPLSIG